MADTNQRSTVPRLAVYGISTTVLTAGVIASAFAQHEYFYTACVQLSQSGTAMLVLANMGLLLTILLGKLLVRVFFGQLRAVEVERLYEQGWLSITETLLALAVLRDQFDVATLSMFVFLLFCKIFHWMLEDRIGFMEQQTRLTALFFVRTLSLSAILAVTDCLMLMYAAENTRRYGATMMIVFGFEYALLLVRFQSTCAKFVLNVIDISRGSEWEEKQSFVFYVDLLHDFAKLLVYLGFFVVLTMYYNLPIHILRELYMTIRSFYTRCGDWVRYRKAMQNMHLRYPTVSQDGLDEMNDKTCIICREEMSGPTQEQADAWNNVRRAGNAQPLSGDTPKQLPCSHVFHFNCLRGWLERQQSCPTCRQSVLEEGTLSQGAQGQNQGRGHDPGAPAAELAAQGAQHAEQGLPVNQQGETPDTDHMHCAQQTEHGAVPQGNGSATLGQSNVGSSNVASSSGNSRRISSVAVGVSANAGFAGGQPDMIGAINGHYSQQNTHAGVLLGHAGNVPAVPETGTLIPIFPSGASSLAPIHLPLLSDFPSPDLSMLSSEQISRLESDSRTAVQERIRILSALQVQLSYMIVALTQVESLVPSAPAATATAAPSAPEPYTRPVQQASEEKKGGVHSSPNKSEDDNENKTDAGSPAIQTQPKPQSHMLPDTGSNLHGDKGKGKGPELEPKLEPEPKLELEPEPGINE
ncbi:E3 ubiquitin-protein ligase hrd1 [Kickxella alabastrina]|uniref:E3 ubiquitin-protein ligase hrd1 n=1 Tax=Kickxella alabastrina TaxID=61397 RepID=A0ACC1ID01_9FUNG|nr:E3 ubiquitin-protein ligase hrd1 [Kickxella alabastrina]